MRSSSITPTINPLTTGAGGKLVSLLLSVLIVSLLFFRQSGVFDLRMQESIFPIIGVGILIAGLVLIYVDRATGYMLLYFILMTVLRFTPESYAFCLSSMVYGGMYLLIVKFWPEIRSHKVLIYNSICVLVLLNVLWIFLQRIGVYWLIYPIYAQHQTGFFANRLETGIFVIAGLPFFFRDKWKWLAYVIVAGVLVLGGMGNIIILVFVLGFYAAIKYSVDWKKSLAVVLAAIAIAISYGSLFGYGSWQIRLKAYERSLPLITTKPIFGWGFGQGQFVFPLFLNGDSWDKEHLSYAYNQVLDQNTFKAVYKEEHEFKHNFTNQLWPEIHNEYLQMWLDGGLVGLGLFLWAICSHFADYVKTKKCDFSLILGLAVMLVSATYFFPFQIGRLLFFCVLMAAIVKGEFKWQEL